MCMHLLKKAKGVKPEDIFFFWCIKIYKVAYRNDYIKKNNLNLDYACGICGTVILFLLCLFVF